MAIFYGHFMIFYYIVVYCYILYICIYTIYSSNILKEIFLILSFVLAKCNRFGHCGKGKQKYLPGQSIEKWILRSIARQLDCFPQNNGLSF